MLRIRWTAPVLLGLMAAAPLCAQTATTNSGMPRVVIPTSRQPVHRPVPQTKAQLYPWKQHITATVFWIGEDATHRNPVPNHKSSWDQQWKQNFGGFDDPDPEARVADHRTSDFRPKNFIPKLNPFYIALPYNDVQTYRSHKPEASKVIPWFNRINPRPGRTSLKGKWVQIYHEGRSCYAQWEDCGPWVTDDWQYVFGDKQPKNRSNKAAGIDISPSVRDYLGLQSGEKCHWRFVEDAQVPYGPWKKYGKDPVARNHSASDLEKKRKYLEYLRKLREEQYEKERKASQ